MIDNYQSQTFYNLYSSESSLDKMSIFTLPQEIYEIILSLLTIDDIVNLSMTSNLMYEFCTNPSYWISRTQKELGINSKTFLFRNISPLIRYRQIKYCCEKHILPDFKIKDKLKAAYYIGLIGDYNLLNFVFINHVVNDLSLKKENYIDNYIDGCLCNHHYNSIIYLINDNPHYWDNKDFILNLMNKCIKNNNIETIKYIIDNYPLKIGGQEKYHNIISLSTRMALLSADLDIIKYLTYYLTRHSFNHDDIFKDIQLKLIQSGRSNVLRYLIEICYLDLQICLNKAACHGCVDVMDDLISFSIKSGCFEIIDWEKILINSIYKRRSEAFQYFIKNGIHNYGITNLNKVFKIATDPSIFYNESFDLVLLFPPEITKTTLEEIIKLCVNYTYLCHYQPDHYYRLHTIINYAIINDIITSPSHFDLILSRKCFTDGENVYCPDVYCRYEFYSMIKQYIVGAQKMLCENMIDKTKYQLYPLAVENIKKGSQKVVHMTAGVIFNTYILFGGGFFCPS